MKRYIAIVAIAAVLAGLRIVGEKSQPFQAAAHLFLGGLCTLSVRDRPAGEWWAKTLLVPRQFNSVVAFVLSLIELAAFLFLPR